VAAFYDDDGEIINKAGAFREGVWTIILNMGAEDGVEIGQTYLLYAIGPEICDPANGASLGNVDIVRGRARVTYVQDKMSRLRSAEVNVVPRYAQSALAALSGDRSPEMIEQAAPMPFVRVGDLARRV
jgi:hypothetical protein